MLQGYALLRSAACPSFPNQTPYSTQSNEFNLESKSTIGVEFATKNIVIGKGTFVMYYEPVIVTFLTNERFPLDGHTIKCQVMRSAACTFFQNDVY